MKKENHPKKDKAPAHKPAAVKGKAKDKAAAKPLVIKKPVIRRKKQEAAKIDIYGLHNMIAPKGAHKKKKLLGRGSSSGHGKTSTRGSKGQTSRAGRHFYLGFEGGQSPLIRRFPKRGFVSNFKKIYQIVNIDDLNRVKETTITLEVLEAKGLIKDKNKLVKILGRGELKNTVSVAAHAFSKSASDAILKSGGKAETLKVNA